MNKIVIIGCPGVGKTTFSRELAKRTNLPLIHLDYYYHDLPKDYENNKDAWRSQVHDLVAGDTWIIEGNYKSTFDIRLPAADTIIYLDYPRRVAILRAIKRRIQYLRKRRAEMPTSWQEKLSPDFVKFIWHFNANVRPSIHTLLSQYKKDKAIILLHSPQDTKNYLRSFH